MSFLNKIKSIVWSIVLLVCGIIVLSKYILVPVSYFEKVKLIPLTLMRNNTSSIVYEEEDDEFNN